jgi:nucleoid-associated protein YgaU
VALALVLFTAWVGIGSGADVLFHWFTAQPSAVAEPSTPVTATEPVGAPGMAPTVTITATTSPSFATPEAPPNLVNSQVLNDLLASSTPNQMVDALDNQAYDIQAFLETTNRPELANLEVAATLRDGKLKLQGFVRLFDQRQSLIELAQRAPVVAEVDAIDLLVRLPPTYTVESGDTLWLISYKLYGENRVAELYNANRDVLSSPETLSVGQTLKVPVRE